jgi:CRP/FNR family transcriptional regulator, cyclic AMP receptor protein
MNAALSRLLRENLVTVDGVIRQGVVRRASTIYSVDSPSEHIYFLETGYVKQVRKGSDGKEVLISIVGPGDIFGEQAITSGAVRTSSAEMLHDGTLYEIPRAVFLEFCRSTPEAWQLISELLIERGRELERKIGLLCLTDVEARILHYLESLAAVFGVHASEGQEYSLPLSQSELATLIGATRETTSTTLNTLARRGVLKLGRRLLTVTSSEALRCAVNERAAKAVG